MDLSLVQFFLKMSKRSRTEKGKSTQPKALTHSTQPKPLFVSPQAENRYILLSTKIVSSGHCVKINDFDHLNLAQILRANSLEEFLSIRESVYTSLVPYFYTNLSFESNRVRSRVLGRDIDISLQDFARLLHLPCEGIDIYNLDLHDFTYPDGESALTASTLLHGNDNPGLVRNEEVRYYTLIAQVLAKIIFYNLLPKSGEYSHARGSVHCLSTAFCEVLKSTFPSLSFPS